MSSEITLKETLRPYLAQALASYQSFLANETWSDCKEFSAYHSACKAVLGHIALLVKLTAQTPETADTDTCANDWIKKVKNVSGLQEDLNVEFD